MKEQYSICFRAKSKTVYIFCCISILSSSRGF